MLLFYVRHGDPIYDPDSLTELGKEQARALAKRFATYGLDEIYSSTSNRAMMTAEPTCNLLKKEMKLCDFANEAHAFGEFTVKTSAGITNWAFHDRDTMIKFTSSEVLALGDEWYKHPCFEGAKFEAGIKRVNAAVDEFLLGLGYKHNRDSHSYEIVKHNEKRVALFAHQGFGVAFLSSVLDIPYPLAARLDMSHSSMTVINFSGGWGNVCVPKILQLSNDSHLYREGIITGYCNNSSLKF